MKRISILATAAIAALALTAVIGATAASATVLCKSGASATCQTSNLVGSGTEISASVVSGTTVLFRTQAGETFGECSGGNLKVQVTDSGGEGKAVKTKDTGNSLTGCTYATTFSQAGTWEVKYTGSGNAKIFDTGTVMKLTYFGLTCYYGFPYESELKGGSTASIVVDGIISKRAGSAGACPETLRMTGTYSVSTPAPLFAEERTPSPAVLCKAAEEHCAEANRYATGTKVSASLKPSTSLLVTETSGSEIDRCTSSALGGEVTSAGGSGSFPVASLTSVSLGGCTFPTTVVGLPWQVEFQRTGTAGNGTATVSGFKVEINTVFFGKCVYAGTPTFNVTGGSQAELSASKVTIEKAAGSAFACPAKALLSASYIVSAPAPLYVGAA